MTAPSPSQWPQQPSAQPPGAQHPAPKNRKPLLIAGILGGAGCLLVLLLVVALIIVFAVRGGGGGGTTGGGEGTPVEATPEEQITAAVTEYMGALESGDSTRALELAPVDDSSALLSTEAYDAALEASPVTDVEIGEPVVEYSSSGTISVSYTVDGQPQTEELMVYDAEGDGTWVLSRGLGASAMVPSSLGGLGFTLNGEEVAIEESLFLLPGAYTPAVSAEHFTLSSEDPLTVIDEAEGLYELEPALTEDGLGAFRTAVQDAVDGCLKQTTLEAGCGIGTLPATTTDGWTLTEDTVRRSLSEEGRRTIEKMEATPRYDEPTFVEGEHIGTVSTEMDCTKDGQQGICEMILGGGMSTPSVDMADPELPVTWS